MKILLIRNDNIGDLICSTPAIEALRKRYPEAQIDLLVNSCNKESPLWVVGEALKRPFLEHRGKIILHISSRLEGNRYPAESFRALLESLQPHPCVITAAPSDKEMAQRLGQLPHVAFVPTANIQELAALISMGSLFVTLDGGALHMGSALDVPTLAILGKTDPRHWAPWGEKHRYLMQPLAPEEIRRAMAEDFGVL